VQTKLRRAVGYGSFTSVLELDDREVGPISSVWCEPGKQISRTTVSLGVKALKRCGSL
jgi:hypothetical protein